MTDSAGRVFHVEAVAFDLDGTLVHTAPDLAASVQAMLRDLERPPVDDTAVEGWIGDGVGRLVKRALTGEWDADPPAELYSRARASFDRHYAREVSRRSRPYPGVDATLRALRGAGIALACVTNKARVYTEALLRDLRLFEAFGVVVSGDTLAVRKPDPGPLLHACEVLEVPAARTLYVGDSHNDAQTARAAGCAFVAVSYGYHGGQHPRTLAPDLLIDSLAELPAHLGGSVKKN